MNMCIPCRFHLTISNENKIKKKNCYFCAFHRLTLKYVYATWSILIFFAFLYKWFLFLWLFLVSTHECDEDTFSRIVSIIFSLLMRNHWKFHSNHEYPLRKRKEKNAPKHVGVGKNCISIFPFQFNWCVIVSAWHGILT